MLSTHLETAARSRSRISKRSLEAQTFPAFIIIAETFLSEQRIIFGTQASFATLSIWEYVVLLVCVCGCLRVCVRVCIYIKDFA